MSLPTVSVVVNNFNYERYVGLAIESALAQRPRPEVVVVDDGSSDGSRALLSEYKRRVKLVLQDNGGQAAAFNSGFAATTGDVVLFLDADDLLAPARFAQSRRRSPIPEWPSSTGRSGKSTTAVARRALSGPRR